MRTAFNEFCFVLCLFHFTVEWHFPICFSPGNGRSNWEASNYVVRPRNVTATLSGTQEKQNVSQLDGLHRNDAHQLLNGRQLLGTAVGQELAFVYVRRPMKY